MHWRFLHGLVWALCGLLTGPALACAICAPSDTQTSVLVRARAAAPLAAGQVLAPDGPGPLSATALQWLRQTLAQPLASDGRVAASYFVPFLQNDDPVIAQAAYEEVAVRPYGELRRLVPLLDASRVRQWVLQPALRPRWPLYGLLHGFTGNAQDAARIGQDLLRPDLQRSAPERSAWVAALLELRGVDGVDWLERNVLSSTSLADADMQAVLLALSVHGNEGGRIPRSRVAQAYAHLVRQQPGRAGFVALDLANWGEWGFAEAFAAALRSGTPQVFSSRYAIVFYLLRNPRPEARALMDALKAEKLI